MKLKKTLKYVFSFLLVLCMMCGLVGNYVPGGTVEAADTASSYTVTLKGRYQSHFFLGNKTKTSGPITLSYTVSKMQLNASGENKVGHNGAIARLNNTGAYPADDGLASVYRNTTDNYLWKIGCTYTLTLGLDASGNLTFDGKYVDDTGKTTILSVATWTGSASPIGTKNTSYQYFGIYYSNNLTGELINVTCTDASGKDLGITSNQTGDYAIEVQKEAEKLMPTSYTVTLKGRYNSHFFLANKTKSSGPITLSYTVSAMQIHPTTGKNTVGQNGAIARSNATGQYPAADGLCSVYQNLTDNYLWKIGCSYTLTLGLDSDGNLTFEGYYVDDAGKTTPLSVEVWTGSPNATGTASTSYQYFGIYYTSNLTGELINVTCTDASGKDLGITSNQTGDYAIGVTEEQNPMVQEFTATKYANYRTNKTGPIAPEGYVFAGWYSNKACTTALKTDTIASTDTAYAKYVDADVLSVKYQLPADVSSGDDTTTLRLVTTVDSLQYSFVGFQIYIGDKFIGAYKTKDVYDKITGTTDSTTVTYKPYVFSSESEYFMAVEITGVPSNVFNQTITVIPAWETLDGTVVKATGNARQDIVIANAIATLEQ